MFFVEIIFQKIEDELLSNYMNVDIVIWKCIYSPQYFLLESNEQYSRKYQ